VNVVITCELSQTVFPAVSIRKILKNERTVTESFNQARSSFCTSLLHLRTHQLHPLQFPSATQLLLTDRNAQSLQPLHVGLRFLIPGVGLNHFFIILGDVSLSLICQKQGPSSTSCALFTVGKYGAAGTRRALVMSASL